MIHTMTDTIIRFFDACQPFGYPLLACSVILIAAILYHLVFTGAGRQLAVMRGAYYSAERKGTPPEEALAMVCRAVSGRRADGPLVREALYVLEHCGEAGLAARVESRLRLYIDSQRAGMATISVITNIAPMLGILGTAWGLVEIFGVFGGAGAEGGIAMGISTALYTTIFGLAIAVPGMIALTCFERGLERRAAQVDAFFSDLLARVGK